MATAFPNDTCSQCCTCPAGVQVEFKSRSRARSRPLCAHQVRCGSVGAYRYFRTQVRQSYPATPGSTGGGCQNFTFDDPTIGTVCCPFSGAAVWPCASDCTSGESTLVARGPIASNYHPYATSTYGYDPTTCVLNIVHGAAFSGYAAWVDTYSNEITEEEAYQEIAGFRAATIADLPAYGSTWTVMSPLSQPEGFANLSSDESSLSIKESIYRVRFRIPHNGKGRCGRVTWIERFIPEGGTAVTSVEAITLGVFRPAVTIAPPPPGGIQARAVCVMDPVENIRVAYVRILNPGRGYTLPPAITIPLLEGWTATVEEGRVTAITGGSTLVANQWSLTLSGGGGGEGGAAIERIDEQGGVALISVSGDSAGWTSRPNVSANVVAEIGMTEPTLLAHLGTEVVRCAKWDGVVPEGYDDAVPATWPLLEIPGGYFTLSVPAEDGTTRLDGFRFYCDCTDCP